MIPHSRTVSLDAEEETEEAAGCPGRLAAASTQPEVSVGTLSVTSDPIVPQGAGVAKVVPTDPIVAAIRLLARRGREIREAEEAAAEVAATYTGSNAAGTDKLGDGQATLSSTTALEARVAPLYIVTQAGRA